MSKTVKGLMLSLLSLVGWLVIAIILPNFQRYNDLDFNRNIEFISYVITVIALGCFGYGIFMTAQGIREKRDG